MYLSTYYLFIRGLTDRMVLSSWHRALNCECPGCDEVFSGKYLPTFQSQKRRHPFLSKGRRAPTNKHGTIIQNTTIEFLWLKYPLIFTMPMSNYNAPPANAVLIVSSLWFLVFLYFSKSDSFSNCACFVLTRHSTPSPNPSIR